MKRLCLLLLASVAGCAPAAQAPSRGADSVAATLPSGPKRHVAATPPITEAQLIGSWQILSLDGRPPLGRDNAERQPHIVFGPEGYGGHSGCNAFGGHGVFDGERYYGGPAGQNMMGCPSLEAQEQAILSLMGSAPRVRLGENGTITLSTGERMKHGLPCAGEHLPSRRTAGP
jgi:heat shock protein HslJ